jgi:nitroreductase
LNVSEAVATRRSVRAFLPQPVPRETIERVLDKARNAPSGGNVQPWNAIVLTGDPLARLLEVVAEVIPQGRAAHAPEYDIYPKGLEGAYEARRVSVGEAMYASLQIPRDDKRARLTWFMRNFQAFGAPVLMLVHTPRYMGPPQWSDIGMWLQTIMLLLREEGGLGGLFPASARRRCHPRGPHLLLRAGDRPPRSRRSGEHVCGAACAAWRIHPIQRLLNRLGEATRPSPVPA